MKHQVFISYSHKDGALVTPVVRLLRATKDFVFMDVDTIQPGRKWRAEVDAALSSASLIVVFWCLHSQESTEVRAEYRAAIEAEKDVLPVLLDSTPVPHELEVFQWVDFRELAGERHSRAKGAGKWKYLNYGCLTAIVIVLLLSISMFRLLSSVADAPMTSAPALTPTLPIDGSPSDPRPSPTKRTRPSPRSTIRGKPTPTLSPIATGEPTSPTASVGGHNPEYTDTPDYTPLIILLVIIGAMVGVLALLMWYGRKNEKRIAAEVSAQPTVQEQMSANLGEEIRRRLPTVN